MDGESTAIRNIQVSQEITHKMKNPHPVNYLLITVMRARETNIPENDPVDGEIGGEG